MKWLCASAVLGLTLTTMGGAVAACGHPTDVQQAALSKRPEGECYSATEREYAHELATVARSRTGFGYFGGAGKAHSYEVGFVGKVPERLMACIGNAPVGTKVVVKSTPYTEKQFESAENQIRSAKKYKVTELIPYELRSN